MALRFVTGPSGSGKSKYVFEQAIRIAGDNLNTRGFVIVGSVHNADTGRSC